MVYKHLKWIFDNLNSEGFNPNFLREWFTRHSRGQKNSKAPSVSIPTFLENGLQDVDVFVSSIEVLVSIPTFLENGLQGMVEPASIQRPARVSIPTFLENGLQALENNMLEFNRIVSIPTFLENGLQV